MRKAFVGLSTPIGFDYHASAAKAPADTMSSPNPVLDSPFGLLLLFDEIVFLTRSLCPQNMRHLPYVKFLDEVRDIPLSQQELDGLRRAYVQSERRELLAPYHSILREDIEIHVRMDNHSHGLDIRGLQAGANTSVDNLAVDRLIVSRLGDPGLELVVNARFQAPSLAQNFPANHAQLAEIVTIEGIPNYLSDLGPYHPILEEIRADKYLSDFRAWVSSKPKSVSRSETAEMKKDVEAALREAQENAFLTHLSNRRHYESLGKAVVGDLLGLVFPLTGTLSAVVENTVDAAQAKEQHWQGFLVGTRRRMR